MSLEVVFYRTESGNEPVRDWLQGLSKQDKKSIGGDIKTVQYGWPIGMPVRAKNGSRPLGNPMPAGSAYRSNPVYGKG